MGTGELGNSWDEDYRARGALYGGAPRPVPAFPDGARVLELGCGDGKTLTALCGKHRTVVAVDYSPRAALLARAKRYPAPGPEIIVSDALHLPCRDRSFDAISACHVLGHSTAAGRKIMANEILRLLCPGGLVWFSDFSVRDFRYGTGQETEPGTFVRGTGIATHYFSWDDVQDLFSGFDQVFLRQESWTLRVRGTCYPRSEIAALFRRPP